MTPAEARRRLEGFGKKRIEAKAELAHHRAGSEAYIKVQASIEALDRSIDETREWYLIGELEALNTTSAAMNKSSKSMEALTTSLFVLTTIIAIVGSASYFLQAAGDEGLTGTQAIVAAGIGTIVVAVFVVAVMFVVRNRYSSKS